MSRTVINAIGLNLALSLLAFPLLAQESIEVIGTLRFDDQTDAPSVHVNYGFGSRFSDTTDHEEVEIFATPPGSSFYAWMNRECDGEFAGDPCRWQEDYRGVPDSVEDRGVEQFSLEYEIGLLNNSSGPLTLAILNPDFPTEVDSIHFVDPVLPAAFNETITGPAILTIDDEFTTRLEMTVYFNISTSSVLSDGSSSDAASFYVAPSVVNGDVTNVVGQLQPGYSVEIFSSEGRHVAHYMVDGATGQFELPTAALETGSYFVLLRDQRDGRIGVRRFIVVD